MTEYRFKRRLFAKIDVRPSTSIVVFAFFFVAPLRDAGAANVRLESSLFRLRFDVAPSSTNARKRVVKSASNIMEKNEQNLNAEVAASSASEPVQSQTNDASAQAVPLPTYESMNADAPVVTSNVIEERLKNAASKPSSPVASSPDGAAAPSSGRPDRPAKSSPLGTFRDETKRRRDDDRRDGKRDKRDGGKRERVVAGPRGPVSSVPTPNRRARLSDDLEDEFNSLLTGESLDSLMKNDNPAVGAEAIEEGTKVQCRVESIQRDSVFVDVGGRELGLIPLKQFPEDAQPEVGQKFDATVVRFNGADGVYEVSLPFAAAEVGDWLSLSVGSIVEARVVAANRGGLECEVGRLRAFLPSGQIAPFRVENIETFVGERWKCVVTEVNPERRNLVISRRSLMEQERAEKREQLWTELAVGQTREGLVRKIIDVGVFVDLGGVDGFIPISEMGWGRVKHPSEAVKEGDRVNVTVIKLDRDRDRVSLSLKDEALDPWKTIDQNFREGEQVRGRVTSVTSFGAFVEIAPGLQGLVHISEIHYKRIANVADVLQDDDYVDVQILSIDLEKRKISLSIKRTQPDPREVAKQQAAQQDAEAAVKAEADAVAEAEAVRERIRKRQPKGPLKGGLSQRGDNGTGLHF